MHKGLEHGLRKGSLKGLHAGLDTGLAKGQFGQPSPNKNFYVVGVSGDSNKDGFGERSKIPPPGPQTLYVWDGYKPVEIRGRAGTYGGHGTFFQAMAIKIKQATGRPLLIVNGARGGSYITSQPGTSPANLDWSTTGILYTPFKRNLNAALAYAGKQKADMIIFGDGVNDIRFGPVIATIITAFDDLITRFHTDFPNTPIILTQVGVDGSATVTQKLYDLRKYVSDKTVSDSLVSIVCEALTMYSAGFYNADLLHLTQQGYNYQGQMFARWLLLTTYSQNARSVLASMFTDMTKNRRDLIASIVDGIVSRGDWQLLECLLIFFANDEKNTYVDLSLLSGGFPSLNTFVANSHIATDGTAGRFIPLLIQNITARATQNDVRSALYLITNNVPGGTSRTLYGIQNGTTSDYSVIQGSASEIYQSNDNTATTSGGAPPLNAPMAHGVRRSGTTKAKVENKTEVHSAVVTSIAPSAFTPVIGAGGGSSSTSFFDGTYGWFLYSAYTGFDYDTTYDDIEFARAHWND